MQPWYQDSELGRDRSAILEMPLEDALQSPSSRFILTHAGSVLVKRPRHGRNTTLKDDRFSVAGLFLPFDRLPPGASDDEDAVVAWLGSKSGMDFWVLDLPAGGGSSAHPYSVESLLALRRAKKDDDDGWEAAPLRQFGDRMESAEDAAVYATANGLVAFHRSHPFCSRCGRRTVSAKAGACRRCEGGSDCPSAPSTVYPRIDAATIMLITSPSSLDGGEHCLLGRKKNWPKGRWSTLAGFVEVGETLEQCVGREVLEESGVAVDLDSVAFVASQPWPFPRSLMVGFQAEAKAVGGVTSNAEEEEEEEEGEGEHGSGVLPSIAYDPNEMEDVRWFKRDFVAARLDGGSTALDFTPTAREAEFHLPGRASLARVLITQWALATPEGCGAAAAAVAAEREGGAGGDADADDEEEGEKAEEKEARRQQRGRKFKRKKPLVFVAHRGARTEAPENTLRALRRAFYARGAGGCEFDLRRTVDGELVLLHDDTLRRTARKPPGGGGAEEVGSGGGSKPLPSSIFYQSLEEYNAILDAPVEELTFAEVDAVRVGPDDDDTPALLSEALEVLLEVTTAAQRKKAKEKAEKGAAEDEDGEEAAKTREKDEELLPFFLAELKGGDLRSVALAADVLQKECGFFAHDDDDDDDGGGGGGGGGGKAARAAAAAAAAAPLGALRPEQVRWIGFDLAVMEEAKRAMPRHAAYLIVEALDEGAALAAVADAASAGLDGVDFLALPHVVTAAVVDAARAAGLVVAAWESCNHPSTDTAATWEALDRNGVELFTSSMPSALDEWRARIGV